MLHPAGRIGFSSVVLSAAVLAASVTFASLAQFGGRDREPASKATGQNPQPQNRFGHSKPKPRKPGAIRIATYNMLNLFDHVDDSTLQGEFDDIKFPTADERCRELAEAIKAIDADIIALEEVESLEALKWFRDTYLSDAGYKYLESKDVGYFRGVECSVMSRFKITRSRVWLNESLDRVKREGLGWAPLPAGEKLQFQRSPLMVEVEVKDDYKLTIFALHHKAGNFKHHREAEALRIVELIDEIRRGDSKCNIIVMGDFNAAPWDKSLRAYLEAGFVDTLAYRTTSRDDPETPLFKTHESDRVLDYILLNSAAFREYIPGSGFVYGTLTPPPSYNYETDPHPPGYASDHYPVVIDLIPKDQ